eukprot:4089309-Amphidinium_carterae.1
MDDPDANILKVVELLLAYPELGALPVVSPSRRTGEPPTTEEQNKETLVAHLTLASCLASCLEVLKGQRADCAYERECLCHRNSLRQRLCALLPPACFFNITRTFLTPCWQGLHTHDREFDWAALTAAGAELQALSELLVVACPSKEGIGQAQKVFSADVQQDTTPPDRIGHVLAAHNMAGQCVFHGMP